MSTDIASILAEENELASPLERMSQVLRNVCDDDDMSTAPQVLVFGEALIDLIVTDGGAVEAVCGGAPFNAARALGRLGVETAFVGAISEDRFGDDLFSRLTDDGVHVDHVRRTTAPTTLALAELSDDGSASYRFYVDGTAARETAGDDVHVEEGWILTGGLGLVLPPVANHIAQLVAERPPTTLALIDINCRPLVITQPDEYRARLNTVVAAADVIKVSDEDLKYLYPELDAIAAAHRLLEEGPKAVVVTAGSSPVEILTSKGSTQVAVPHVDIVDTVGAGDTFCAGFVAWWVQRSTHSDVHRDTLSDLDLVAAAATAGVHASAIAVGRRGADPPYREELSADLWG
ncbi:MAG: carbohydrate kinase family protein [Ilumatobacteraceae bacterium]